MEVIGPVLFSIMSLATRGEMSEVTVLSEPSGNRPIGCGEYRVDLKGLPWGKKLKPPEPVSIDSPGRTIFSACSAACRVSSGTACGLIGVMGEA